MPADPETLARQLAEATTAAREALSDLRSELKETRRVLREVRRERGDVEVMVRRTVDDEVGELVHEQVEALGEKTRQAMDEAVARVERKFAELENLMMTGNRRGRPSTGFDLRSFIEEQGR